MLSGSFDQSPNLCDVYSSWAESTVAKQPRGSEELDEKMKENLAEAMLESPIKDGGPSSIPHVKKPMEITYNSKPKKDVGIDL